VGIWITPDICTLFSSSTAPMLGARASIWPSSRISHPTDAQRIVPGASNDARKDQAGIGCALSSHSTITRGQSLERLTLAEALATGRVEAFAAQAEADSIGPADRAQFDAMMGRITAPLPEGQTSRSRGPGSSRGK